VARRREQPTPAMVQAGGDPVTIDGTTRVQRTITAAALNVDLADKRMRKRLRGTRKDQDWQHEAWVYFDTIPIIGFAGDFTANAISRLRIFVGWSDLPSDTPAEVDPDNPPDGMDVSMYEAAAAILQRVDTGMGITEMGRKAAYNLTIPGELYVIGRVDENGEERFDAWSTSEVDLTRDDKPRIRTTPDTSVDAIEVDPASMFVRIWRPHPQWNDLANTPMKRLLELCDELRLIRRYMRDATRTRLNAGIFEIPEEWGFSKDRNRNENGDPYDRMEDLMLKAMTAAISDEESAATVIPIIVHSGTDQLGKARHITFDRPFDAVAAQQREKLAAEIAGGIDLPDQVLLGLGDVKFRNAEVITDEQFKLHLEPLAIVWVRSLTLGVLHTLLIAQGFDPGDVRRFSFWYDAAAITSDPDRSESSNFGFTNDLLSGAAWRTYNGYTDQDAPDDAELAARQAARQPAPALPVGQDGAAAAGSGDGAQDPLGLAAASRARDSRRIERLGPRMANAERSVRLKVQMAADAAMRRGFDRIGAQARSRPEMRAQLTRVGNHAVVTHLGLERIVALGINPIEILRAELDKLKVRYVEMVAKHQGNVVGMVAQASGVPPDALLAILGDRPGVAIDASWARLETSLLNLAGDELFLSQMAADAVLVGDVAGEFDPGVSVPAGLVRESLAVAGGNPAPHPADVLGGIASGPFTDEVLGEVGLGAGGYEWLYGDVATRGKPFEPHSDLDGVLFEDFNDPQLTNPTDWPGPTLYPGDHSYCQCEAAPRLVERTPAFIDPVAPSTLRQRGLSSAPPDEAAFAKSAVPSLIGR
jgi:hypothetical protein